MNGDCYLLMKREATGTILRIAQPTPPGSAAIVAMLIARQALPGWECVDWCWKDIELDPNRESLGKARFSGE